MKLKTLSQPFNDGVLTVYTVGNIAAPGNMPKDGLAPKFSSKIPYEERTVGVTRFYAAKQEQSTVNQVLRIPRINGMSQADKVVPIDGEQYDIVQIQFINDIEPPSMDLSLQLRSVKYDIKGY
jgi:hypothetical protein